MPASLAANVLNGGELKPELAKRGIVLHREVSPSISFFFFNLDNPLVGGYTPEKLALRRAISMGFDREAQIRQLLHGQAIPATQPVPPATLRARPQVRSPLRLRSRRPRARCSTSSATRTATATAIASCPTASR